MTLTNLLIYLRRSSKPSPLFADARMISIRPTFFVIRGQVRQRGRFGSSPAHSQIRSYYYFPVSWEEFKERLYRWVDTAEERFVKVRLVSRQHRRRQFNQGRRQIMSRFVGRTAAKWRFWVQKQRKRTLGAPSALPLPSVTPDGDGSTYAKSLRARYQGWKIRRKEQYQGWKSKRQEQYQSWKVRRQEQYQGWKLRRQIDWIRTKQIVLNEYSRPEWFDELGRPLTSKSFGRFVNPWQSQSTNGVHSFSTLLNWRLQRFRREYSQIGGAGRLIPKLSWTVPVRSAPTATAVSKPLPNIDSENLTLTWVGHSTCWIQINGFTVLTDPIFSLRSSPYQSLPIGVARDVPPSHSIQQLVEHAGGAVDLCCITHDHYDHMDRGSVEQLAPHVNKWVVPLGIKDWLVEKCGVISESVVELEWWQQSSFARKIPRAFPTMIDEQTSSDDLTITLTPAQHWSSRTLFDRNKRLWGSFAITSRYYRLFFCGDTGYPSSFPLFRQIADTLGPFDLSCIPIGAYLPEELNKFHHVNPSDAVKIAQDLKSGHSVAIHWGTFALGEEDMDDPPRALEEALQAERTILSFETLEHGNTIQISHATASSETQWKMSSFPTTVERSANVVR